MDDNDDGPHAPARPELAKELHRKAYRPKVFRHVLARGCCDIWAVDFLGPLPLPEKNDGMLYLCCCVDVYSRMAWVQATKDVQSATAWSCLGSFIKQAKAKPANVWLDSGSSFLGEFSKKLEEHNIRPYSTYGYGKASSVESFIGHFSHALWERMDAEETHGRWLDLVKPLLATYNRTKRTATGMTPLQVLELDPEEQAKLHDHLYGAIMEAPTPATSKFKIGDFVRVSRDRGLVEKGRTESWTLQLYVVVAVRYDAPAVTYTLKEVPHGDVLKGAFYDSELQLSRFSPHSGVPNSQQGLIAPAAVDIGPDQVRRVVGYTIDAKKKGKFNKYVLELEHWVT